MTTSPNLSRAQRDALHAAIHGKPLDRFRPGTLQSLHRKGMLAGIAQAPTDKGRAVFSPQVHPDLKLSST